MVIYSLRMRLICFPQYHHSVCRAAQEKISAIRKIYVPNHFQMTLVCRYTTLRSDAPQFHSSIDTSRNKIVLVQRKTNRRDFFSVAIKQGYYFKLRILTRLFLNLFSFLLLLFRILCLLFWSS